MKKAFQKDVGVILHKDNATFRVWAPFAVGVSVTGSFNDWSLTPMTNEGDGYWSVVIEKVQAGQEYKYVIDTGHGIVRKNDPRALQVTTAAGNSVIVDTDFDWDGDTFVPVPIHKQVLYELHIGTFNRIDASTPGTFQTAAEKLDYLAELGVTTVEIMPIGSMRMDHGWWGYVSDYIYAVESLYGGRHEFMKFVKAAHARNIGVVLDVVYNHFGPDTNMDLWQFDGWSQDGKGGIYFYNDWRGETPWGDEPNSGTPWNTRPDYGRPEVRQYIADNARMWLQDCHVDGLRVDSVIYIRNVRGRNNDPEYDLADGWKVLQEITSLARKVKPDVLLIGEDISGNEYITKPVSDGGAGFSAQWEVDFPYIIRTILLATKDEDRNIDRIREAFRQIYNGDCFQRVIYSDSHDSAANGGARLQEELSPGNPGSVFARRRMLLASSIVLTAPGIPMLFQGQDFMEGGSFNDWRALDWAKAEQFAGIALATKHLIALRKNQYGTTRGLTGQSADIIHLSEESKMLGYHRWDQGGPGDDVMVIINFANRTQKDYAINFPRNGTWQVRFNSDWKGYSQEFKDITPSEVHVEANIGTVSIAPYSVMILSQDS